MALCSYSTKSTAGDLRVTVGCADEWACGSRKGSPLTNRLIATTTFPNHVCQLQPFSAANGMKTMTEKTTGRMMIQGFSFNVAKKKLFAGMTWHNPRSLETQDWGLVTAAQSSSKPQTRPNASSSSSQTSQDPTKPTLFHIVEVSSPFTLYQAVPSLTVQYARSGAMTFISLKFLSLRNQLGHCPGVTCINPKRLSGNDFFCPGHRLQWNPRSWPRLLWLRGSKNCRVQVPAASILHPATASLRWTKLAAHD